MPSLRPTTPLICFSPHTSPQIGRCKAAGSRPQSQVRPAKSARPKPPIHPKQPNNSLTIPHPRNLGIPHLPLQLKNPIHQRLRRRRTPGHVNINRHNPIAPPDNTIRIMVVPSAVGTRAHGNHPPRLRHLIVHLSQRGRHLVGQRARDDHHVGLTRRGTEDDAQSVLIVARGGEVHHFDGAAGEAEGHGPEGGLTAPVGDLVEGGA